MTPDVAFSGALATGSSAAVVASIPCEGPNDVSSLKLLLEEDFSISGTGADCGGDVVLQRQQGARGRKYDDGGCET
jgi:hypothetical protein